MKFLSFIVIFALFLSSTSAQKQEKSFDAAEFEKTVAKEMAATKTPGAAVAIVSGNRVIYAKGFGRTSVESETAVTPDTLFRMGSTTKMFTAAALLSLANDGKLRLDAPLGNYLKNLSPRVSHLTAHQILSQSSGLRDLPPTVFSNDDAGLKENIRAWKDDVFFTAPNEIYSYSSANYWLAGLLTEELRGKPYADALGDTILKPLGMNRSTVRPGEAMTFPLALGHDIKDKAAAVIRPVDNNSAKYPGGSLFSSANDLGRFAVAMLNGGKIENRQVLSAFVVENLPKPRVYLPGGKNVFYGYGLLGMTDRGVKTVSHGGASRGYGSFILFAPERKIAVVVLANTSGQTLPKTRAAALEMLLPFEKLTQKPAPELKTNAEDTRKFVGKYEHAPQIWEILTRGGKLFVKTGDKEFELKKTGDKEFEYEQGGIMFVPGKTGAIEHIFTGLYAARRID